MHQALYLVLILQQRTSRTKILVLKDPKFFPREMPPYCLPDLLFLSLPSSLYFLKCNSQNLLKKWQHNKNPEIKLLPCWKPSSGFSDFTSTALLHLVHEAKPAHWRAKLIELISASWLSTHCTVWLECSPFSCLCGLHPHFIQTLMKYHPRESFPAYLFLNSCASPLFIPWHLFSLKHFPHDIIPYIYLTFVYLNVISHLIEAKLFSLKNYSLISRRERGKKQERE